MTADDPVCYELLAQPGGVYWRYELVRVERGEREVLSAGSGLTARMAIVAYLRDVSKLDGLDAAPALAAMKAGWRRLGAS